MRGKTCARTPNFGSPKMKVLGIHAKMKYSRKSQTSMFEMICSGLDEGARFVNIFSTDFYEEISMIHDVVIVNYDVTGFRTSPSWHAILGRLSSLSHLQNLFFMVQDDYLATAEIESLILRFDNCQILTPLLPYSSVIYSSISPEKLRGTMTLLPTFLVSGNERAEGSSHKDRNLDYFQSVRKLGPEYGSIGQRKYVESTKVARVFELHGLRVQFLEPDSPLEGGKWTETLRKSRFSTMLPGGSSVLDRKYRYSDLANQLRAWNSKFGDWATERILELRGNNHHNFTCPSPRLLEATLQGVANVMPSLTYPNFDLQPGVHYLSFSRPEDQIVEDLKDNHLSEGLAANMFSAIMENEDFRSENFLSDLRARLNAAANSPMRPMAKSDAIDKLESKILDWVEIENLLKR